MPEKSEFKQEILNYIKRQYMPKTPTEIGIALGLDYNIASSKVCYHLKKLVSDGLIRRIKRNGKVLYDIKK